MIIGDDYMLEMITSYWFILVIAFIIGAVVGNIIIDFFKLPSTSQLSRIKEWLIWAVAAAEKELGSGTGQLKLRYVYGLFTQSWTEFAKVVSFEVFSSWVDDALVRFTKIMQTNKNVVNYVEGDKNGS